VSKPAAPYTTPEDFLFNTPPYDQRSISEEKVKGLFGGNLRLDGYCPYCQARRTFSRSAGAMTQYWFQEYEPANERRHFGELHLKCTRYDHVLRFNWTLASSLIQKVGQFPSFADIALDESKQYNKLLSPQDASEFHRAIGLAAHNIGIGSFVYLRRIFERLIDKRYTDFKDAEGWKDDDFYKLRMAEKITFLKDHLPSFLVKNAKIYSILSVGLHELSEAECLSFFAVLRQSTVLILEEDKKKREELKMQHELEKAISGFSMTIAVEAPTSEADG
jgi:hypothetical protein